MTDTPDAFADSPEEVFEEQPAEPAAEQLAPPTPEEIKKAAAEAKRRRARQAPAAAAEPPPDTGPEEPAAEPPASAEKAPAEEEAPEGPEGAEQARERSLAGRYVVLTRTGDVAWESVGEEAGAMPETFAGDRAEAIRAALEHDEALAADVRENPGQVEVVAIPASSWQVKAPKVRTTKTEWVIG